MPTFTRSQLDIANKVLKYLAYKNSYIGFDRLVSEIKQNSFYSFQDIQAVINILADEQIFIKYVNPIIKDNLQLTQNGRVVVELGSIEKWYAKQEAEKANNDILQKQSLKAARSSAYAAWVSGIIAGGALLLSIYQYFETKHKANDAADRIKSRPEVNTIKTPVIEKTEPLANGDATFPVPYLIGLPLGDVKFIILGADFKVGRIIYEGSQTNIADGTVIKQYPSGNKGVRIRRYDKIDLYVSGYPPAE